VREHIALYKLFNAWLASIHTVEKKTIIAKNNKLADKQGKTSLEKVQRRKCEKNTGNLYKTCFSNHIFPTLVSFSIMHFSEIFLKEDYFGRQPTLAAE